MITAIRDDIDNILIFYKQIVDAVNKSTVRLGWNTDIYPDISFIKESVEAGEMLLMKDAGRIVAAAVVNDKVNDEYALVDWMVKGKDGDVATIHALATDPEYRGHSISDRFMTEIEDYCRNRGYKAIHLDVIDTNIPGHKLYIRNGYTEITCIEMYYEVVGSRRFSMMEKIL